MTQDELKKKVAEAALQYVVEDAIVGVGSGSTVNLFIDALASIKGRIEGAVAASGGKSDVRRAASANGLAAFGRARGWLRRV